MAFFGTKGLNRRVIALLFYVTVGANVFDIFNVFYSVIKVVKVFVRIIHIRKS
jgi:hypothetical protein